VPRTRLPPDLVSSGVVASFDYEDPSVSVPVPSGAVVVEAKVVLAEAFDGSPTAVFQMGSGTELIPSADMDFEVTNTYIRAEPFLTTTADSVDVVVSASGASQGAGYLVVIIASA